MQQNRLRILRKAPFFELFSGVFWYAMYKELRRFYPVRNFLQNLCSYKALMALYTHKIRDIRKLMYSEWEWGSANPNQGQAISPSRIYFRYFGPRVQIARRLESYGIGHNSCSQLCNDPESPTLDTEWYFSIFYRKYWSPGWLKKDFSVIPIRFIVPLGCHFIRIH